MCVYLCCVESVKNKKYKRINTKYSTSKIVQFRIRDDQVVDEFFVVTKNFCGFKKFTKKITKLINIPKIEE